MDAPGLVALHDRFSRAATKLACSKPAESKTTVDGLVCLRHVQNFYNGLFREVA